MKLELAKGRTSKLLDVFIRDATSTTGAGLTGLVFNSAGLTAYYYREGAGSATAITLATMTVGTWATGGFKEIDATNLPGAYQLGVPDAALATGADSVFIMLKGAANMAPLPLEIQLNDAPAGALTATERQAVADALLDRDMSVGTDSGSPTVRTVRQALRVLRNKFSFSGATVTFTKENDTDVSWTAVVTTDPAALPITGADPAG